MSYLGTVIWKADLLGWKGAHETTTVASFTLWLRSGEVSVGYRSILVGAATAEAGVNAAIKALTEAGGVST